MSAVNSRDCSIDAIQWTAPLYILLIVVGIEAKVISTHSITPSADNRQILTVH